MGYQIIDMTGEEPKTLATKRFEPDLTGTPIEVSIPTTHDSLDDALHVVRLHGFPISITEIVELRPDGKRFSAKAIQVHNWKQSCIQILTELYGVGWEDGFGEHWFDLQSVVETAPLDAVKDYAANYDLDRIDQY